MKLSTNDTIVLFLLLLLFFKKELWQFLKPHHLSLVTVQYIAKCSNCQEHFSPLVFICDHPPRCSVYKT